MRVLIAGLGYVGQALARALVAQGDEVLGVRRNPGEVIPGVTQCALDLCDAHALQGLPGSVDAVVYCCAPTERSDEAYHRAYGVGLAHVLACAAVRHSARRVIFTSSTAVYAEASGDWVDESSPLNGTAFTSKRLIEAEALVKAQAKLGVILRLGGIYGPDRMGFLQSVRRGEITVRDTPARFTNRIHRSDCVGAILHLLRLETPESVYLGVDDEPADQNAVVAWLRQELKLGAATAGEPAAIVRREVGNKRCSNRRLRASGYVFRYPSFREGYAELLKPELR